MSAGKLLVAVLLCLASGCAGSDVGPAGGRSSENSATGRGGTLRFANPGDWDSLDPANTYSLYSWNFARLYGRSLVMFAPASGKAGSELVPDLAESLGRPSGDGKTWTYTLRAGIRFEDGTPITAKDVKYAVERSLDKATFPNGPTYLNDFLDLQGYVGPYADTDPARLGLKAVETPDDRTIVFRLSKPFSGFDYFAQLPASMPVPQAKDTGTRYKDHVYSTGPYMFERITAGSSFTLVRNPYWDPATDPHRMALPDRIEVTLNVNADDIDNRLLSGDLDVDVAGAGLQPAGQARVLANPQAKANVDSALGANLWFTVLNADVIPLDNVHCRRAVLYAADRSAYQRAFGGDVVSERATNLMPPVITGAERFDPFPSERGAGDLDRARSELQQCGRPTGFGTNISYRAELPREKAAAEAIQQSLARVGIDLELRPYPASDYLSLYAGKPEYARSNNLGLMSHGWAADWPDGYGFLAQIVDSRVIRPTGGNTNLGIRDARVDQLVDEALQAAEAGRREQLWVQVDKTVMDDAFVLPGVWSRGLLYRPPQLTNAYITDGYQMFDYVALGTTRH